MVINALMQCAACSEHLGWREPGYHCGCIAELSIKNSNDLSAGSRDQGMYMTAWSAKALQLRRWTPRQKHCSNTKLCNFTVAQGRLRLRHVHDCRERKRVAAEEMGPKAAALQQQNSYLKSLLENKNHEKQLLARWRPVSLPGIIQ